MVIVTYAEAFLADDLGFEGKLLTTKFFSASGIRTLLKSTRNATK